MVRVRIQTTQQETAILTKAARRTGLRSPSQFVAALFNGDHADKYPRKTNSAFRAERMAPYRWKP